MTESSSEAPEPPHRPDATENPQREFLRDVIDGLGRSPKRLPCKYLYDERGSRLFDRICELPEYYPTRTELEIMRRHAAEMAECIDPRTVLVEFGSGSSHKTRALLDVAENIVAYVPVDISREHLFRSAARLAERYPRVAVHPLCADFTREFALPRLNLEIERTLVYFPGSTIGNFDRAGARRLLERIARLIGASGSLLIGVDLQKPVDVLKAAYDDAQGVTAQFNRNLLVRINRELGADFDLDSFAHEVRYNTAATRIEMHLKSLREQWVTVDGHRFHFAAGETIHTENSHKYTLAGFAVLAGEAGLAVRRVWTDERENFSVQLLGAAD